jgi:uncharacterized protein with HEPN domain
MSRRVAKEYLHLRDWIARANELVSAGEVVYFDSHLLPEAGDSLLMKIGEAANRLSRLGVSAPDGISWTQAIDQRNWLIHQYDQVDRDVTWATLTRDLPRWDRALRSSFAEAEARLADQSD